VKERCPQRFPRRLSVGELLAPSATGHGLAGNVLIPFQLILPFVVIPP